MCVHGGNGKNQRLGEVIRKHGYSGNPTVAVEQILGDVMHFAHTNNVNYKKSHGYAAEDFQSDVDNGGEGTEVFNPRG
jgi:hypothetical protein